MKRWLLKQDEAIDEPAFAIEPDRDLQCTRSGQVLTDFNGLSVFDLNRERERELRKERESAVARLSREAFRSEVKKRLGLADWKSRRLRVKSVDWTISCFMPVSLTTFEVDRGIDIAVVNMFEDRAGDNPAVVVVGGGWEPLGERVEGGPKTVESAFNRTFSLNLRGHDDLPPFARPPGHESPFGPDWREAFMALAIDRPLLGQRVADLLSILEALENNQPGAKAAGFHVVGVGLAGPAVLHAALLDERGLIKKVTVRNSLVSWSRIVEQGLSRDQLANVVPGVLSVYDLPELAARLAPLPLSIVGSVDALGKVVPTGEAREAYAIPVKAYADSGKFELR
jgi:hypothetical protein